MATQTDRFIVWRRPADTLDAWVLMPGTESDSRVGAYNLAMDEELASGELGQEYQIEKVGVVPDRDDRLPQRYRTRVMRSQ